MNIKAQTDNKISIELTKEDMKNLDITYDELDYSNVETRRVLWTLLDEAGHILGRNISLTSKMLIEAVPDENGGCILYFTVVDEDFNCDNEIKVTGRLKTKTVCQSDDIENIGALARALYNTGSVAHSELYSDGKKFRLIISSKPGCSEKTKTVANEFCDICNSTSATVTYEHWKLLASPDAIGILTALSR